MHKNQRIKRKLEIVVTSELCGTGYCECCNAQIDIWKFEETSLVAELKLTMETYNSNTKKKHLCSETKVCDKCWQEIVMVKDEKTQAGLKPTDPRTGKKHICDKTFYTSVRGYNPKKNRYE